MHRVCGRLLLLVGLCVLGACDDGPGVNRSGDACDDSVVTLRVEVLSADGARVRGATVTAATASSNRTLTSVTNEDGVSTAISELVGPGTMRVWASAGTKVSDPATVEWVCDECHCSPTPEAVQLQLSR